MPYPLDAGKNFKVEYVEKSYDYSMKTMEMYTEYYGIGYIVSGDRKVSTPNRTFFAHKGFISLMNMNIYHHSSPISTEPYIRYGIKFAPAMARRIISHIGRKNFEDLMSHSSYRLDDSAQLCVLRIFEEMLDEYSNYDRHSEFILQGLLEQLIILILRNGKITESAELKADIQDSVILNILSYIDRHYAQNPTIEELARLAGLSESHFMKRFRESVNSSYKTYLNQYKIQIAQGLLLNTTLSLNRISEELGFCNSNYFSSTFKKYMNVSPLQYRKLHGG